MSHQKHYYHRKMDNCLFNMMLKYGCIKQSLVLNNGEQLVVKCNSSLWVSVMCYWRPLWHAQRSPGCPSRLAFLQHDPSRCWSEKCSAQVFSFDFDNPAWQIESYIWLKWTAQVNMFRKRVLKFQIELKEYLTQKWTFCH